MSGLLDKSILVWMCVLTVGVFLLRSFLKSETRWVVCSMAAGNLALAYADAFISSDLQVSSHIGYLTGTTLAILAILVLNFFYSWASSRFQKTDWVVALVCLALIVHGVLLGVGTYRRTLDFSSVLQEQLLLLNEIKAGEGDLVIAPVEMIRQPLIDTPAVWIPLASSSQVLYAITAFFALPSENRSEIVAEREAAYLYLRGRTAGEIAQVASDPRAAVDMRFLASGGIFPPVGFSALDPTVRASSVREVLVPAMEELERNPSQIESLLGEYNRILVLDNMQAPTFSAERIEAHMELVERREVGDSVLSVYKIRTQ